jgi:hypothetical protein
VALVQPLQKADTLQIICSFTIEHAHSMNLELPLSPSAELFPFAYTLEERYDLEHYLRPYHDDPDGELTAWARPVHPHRRTDRHARPSGGDEPEHPRQVRLRRARRGRARSSRSRP